MNCPKALRFVSLCVMLLAATPVLAQVTPVIFERSDIRIDPVTQAAPPPAKEGETPPPALARPAINYNVEVRAEDALKLEYIHTLNTLTESTGVIILFDAPSIVALPRMQVFTPVDALFVAEDGTILQIYPDVTLGNLQQDVYAKDPVKAFVFLKAGEVAARQIMPKDIIAGGMFYPAPPVMQ